MVSARSRLLAIGERRVFASWVHWVRIRARGEIQQLRYGERQEVGEERRGLCRGLTSVRGTSEEARERAQLATVATARQPNSPSSPLIRLTSRAPSYTSPSQDKSKKMTYEIRKSTTKVLEFLGPTGEHIWRSRLEGCWGMMPGGQGRG